MLSRFSVVTYSDAALVDLPAVAIERLAGEPMKSDYRKSQMIGCYK